jgi:acetylornithine aminotransferase
LKEIREICTAHGALLAIDAVQTGIGRTGQWFGYEYSGITPDVITVAKGLGAGLPLAAMIAVGESSQLFIPGDHGSTFGGNPVTTAASIAAIKWIEKNKILGKVKADYKYISTALRSVPGVTEVRGAGLLIGIELCKNNSAEVATLLQNSGVLVNAANPNSAVGRSIISKRALISLPTSLTELLQGRSFEGLNDVLAPTFNSLAVTEPNNFVDSVSAL